MTLVDQLLHNRLVAGVVDRLPVPMRLVRFAMLRDNALENRKDSWGRLRADTESARYAGVRAVTERYAAEGFVLDVGCSQGILQEGLRYRRYLGVDSFADSIARAGARSDDRTAFVQADGSGFEPDEPPDAVVLNEVIYYLPDPIVTLEHYAGLLTGGVVIVSIYARSWSSRRLLRQAGTRLQQVETSQVESGHLAWTIAVFRAR